ncbi:hypothetical protein OPV22_019843 [Ensete ventricosum]|uniref:Dof-type domain-containing protein n=1 Tax=Ensete ventricosum TaxID=4639 RepID=A0AAV8PBJ4_ENSVE|nr:hypothetical protein OPV22_019843 [Ensete ventricosum]
MKRIRPEGAPPSAKIPAKAPRRQKASAPRSAAAGRARTPASKENAPEKGEEGDNHPVAAAGSQQAPSSLQSALAEEEAVGWGDGAGELGEWWYLGGVEEEKLSGWFPFVDEDFLCSDSGGGEGWWGGLLWEDADHDIWQLQHIHEIPRTAAK